MSKEKPSEKITVS